MKTSVIMSRKLFGMSVAQNSKTEFFSSTDLVKAGNKWRVINGHSLFNEKAWFKNKGTEEFMAELEGKFGKVKIPARGRGNHTWIHPLLFIDMALAISPTLKIEVYEWMFDNLIKYRNEGGDSYKKMCGALFVRSTAKANFPIYISDVAKKIKLACGVENWNQATEQQLTTRKKLHNDIALLSDVLNDNDQAVRIAVLKLE